MNEVRVVLENPIDWVWVEDLGPGSVVRDRDGGLWLNFRKVGWRCFTGDVPPSEPGVHLELSQHYGPYTLVHKR